MPYVVCEKHGSGVAPLVCSHLSDRLVAGLSIDKPALVETEYDGVSWWGVWLCRECAIKHGYPPATVTKLHGDAGLDEIFDRIEDQVPVCSECFREARPESNSN
jgi:hypothetical protein